MCNNLVSRLVGTSIPIRLSAGWCVVVQKNQLRSSIPESLNRLSNLLVLRLGYNRFSGDMSPKWAGMRALRVLDVRVNALTGVLPSVRTLLIVLTERSSKLLPCASIADSCGCHSCLHFDSRPLTVNNFFEWVSSRPVWLILSSLAVL